MYFGKYTRFTGMVFGRISMGEKHFFLKSVPQKPIQMNSQIHRKIGFACSEVPNLDTICSIWSVFYSRTCLNWLVSHEDILKCMYSFIHTLIIICKHKYEHWNLKHNTYASLREWRAIVYLRPCHVHILFFDLIFLQFYTGSIRVSWNCHVEVFLYIISAAWLSLFLIINTHFQLYNSQH